MGAGGTLVDFKYTADKGGSFHLENATVVGYTTKEAAADQKEGKEDESSESNLMKAITSRSEMVDAAWTLSRVPALLSKNYGTAVRAVGKMGAIEVLGKVTGALSLYSDYNEYKEARAKGDTWGAVWSATKGVMQVGFLLGGGEEIELGWNLGTMAIDGIINYNKK